MWYRIQLAFKPTKALSKVVLSLTYSGNNNVSNKTFRCGVASSCPANTSTEGTAFTWSSKAATITLTQSFSANTTYYIWVWSPDNIVGYVALSSYTATGTVATYTVSYNANGGTGAPGSQTKDYGATLTLSSTKPTKSSTTATGSKITFNANGGTTTKASQTATDTTKYTFSSWNTAAGGGGTSYSSGGSYTANASATLYAQYTSSTTKGSVTLPTTAQCSRAGYDLLGFATSSTATTAAYAPGASYTASAAVTLYAVWAAQGLVYIDDGTGFEPYQVWIDNGSSWEQYAPFVDNGTTWEEMS
jgi:hypothetical protein